VRVGDAGERADQGLGPVREVRMGSGASARGIHQSSVSGVSVRLYVGRRHW
jgi:hypothetical protein